MRRQGLVGVLVVAMVAVRLLEDLLVVMVGEVVVRVVVGMVVGGRSSRMVMVGCMV